MNTVLVNPPNHRHDAQDLAPPLGLLVLGDALIQAGIPVALLDFNFASFSGAGDNATYFYHEAVEKILAFDPAAVCFTSMGINSHVALLLAKEIKKRKPAVVTVFGGPHFSSVADCLARLFPWVDYVIVGEGEGALPSLLKSISHGRIGVGAVGSIIKAPGSEVQQTHPWNAYKLINLAGYFERNPRKILNVETGRGCKYNCAFCYSPKFWENHSDVAAERIGADFERAFLAGAKHLFVVGDNFLNDRAHAIDLCTRVAGLRVCPTWNCYATLPDIDEEIAELLGSAKCVSAYIGIDAVSQAQKRLLGKHFLRNRQDCVDRVRALVANSVTPTCSFILDPFTWTADDLEETFKLALELRLQNSELSFHTLTSYAGTRLRNADSSVRYVPDHFRLRLMFDCPEVVISNSLVTDAPYLFPFHSRRSGDYDAYCRGVMLIYLAQILLTEYAYELQDLVDTGTTTLLEILNVCLEGVWFSGHEPHPITHKKVVSETFEKMLAKDWGFMVVGTGTGRQ